MERKFVLCAIFATLAPQLSPAADPAALQATIARLRAVEVPAAQRIVMDQVYDGAHPESCRLDLYLPKPGKRLPLVVYIHGGGWAYGTRLGIRSPLFLPVLDRLLSSGVAVASLDYRFATDGNTVRQCVRDVFAGLSFLGTKGAEYGVDPACVGVLGDSAGGHLGLMLALADASLFLPERQPPASRIGGLVVWYGPSDFTSAASWGDERRLSNLLTRMGATQKDDSLARLLSPVTHLRRGSPRILCIHGDGDTGVPLLQAQVLARKAAQVGARLELRIVHNAGHNWREAGGAIKPGKEEIQRLTADFLIDAVKQ